MCICPPPKIQPANEYNIHHLFSISNCFHCQQNLDPDKVFLLPYSQGNWPRARPVCSQLKLRYSGEERGRGGGGGLTESGIVKHYGDVQIRNSQKKKDPCSPSHVCAHTHAQQRTLPSSLAVTWQRLRFIH